MSIKLGSPDQEKIWLTAWQSRPTISSCDANRQLLEEQLDLLLQPLTVPNVLGVLDALDAVGQLAAQRHSVGNPPTLKVQPVEPVVEPEPEIDFRKMTVAALRLYLKNQNSNRKTLPSSYTKDVIRGLSLQAYEKLSLEYGSNQVRNRLAEKS